RIDAECFALEMIDRGAAKIVEIMGKDFGRETDRDAFGAFQQDDGELGRQSDRFPGATIVAQLPRGRLWIEQNILRKGREACLDVTGRGRLVAREHVTVIPLRLDEEGALSDCNERRPDRGVAVGM